MLPDGDAEVELAEMEILNARAILEKETHEALAAEREFQREREEADVAVRSPHNLIPRGVAELLLVGCRRRTRSARGRRPRPRKRC